MALSPTRTVLSTRGLFLAIALVGVYHRLSLATIEEKRTLAVQKKPNILLLFLDQWRFDWDGMHPTTPNGPLPLQMPFLRSCADRGVRFTQAYVPAPLCAPVRACLASGKEYDKAGVLSNHVDSLPANTVTFYKLLRDEGDYHVMVCGKDDLFHGDINFPFNKNEHYQEFMDLGFSDASRSAGKTRVTKEDPTSSEPYHTHLLTKSMLLQDGIKTVSGMDAYKACYNNVTGAGTQCDATSFTDDIYPDDFVKNEAIALLDRAPTDKSWYLQVNFPGPHPPVMTTAAMARSVRDRVWPLPVKGKVAYMSGCPQSNNDDFEPVTGERCNYGAQLENLDKLLEQIVDKVTARNDIDNTVVCITGDHGEQLGDHGNIDKKMPWQSSISVPLICFGPNMQRGVVHEGPVTTLDLPGTFLDLASVPKAGPMTVQSLLPLLRDNTVSPPRPFISSGLDAWRLVVKETHGSSYKLICCKGDCPGTPENVPKLGAGETWQVLLYNTGEDQYDQTPVDNPTIRDELLPHLPPGWCSSAEITEVSPLDANTR